MNKWLFVGVAVIVILIAIFFALNSYIYNEKQATVATDYKDAEYIIEGERIKLKDGFFEVEAAPNSVSKTTNQYFGNEVMSDLNNDGREDVVFLITHNTAGSGIFYYVVAALNTESGYVGSEAYLLGDRIAPQSTEMSQDPDHKNVIVVNYADRRDGEPMTSSPSVAKSVFLKLDPEALQFGVVDNSFTGEADPLRMSLEMKTWTWESALFSDGREINAADESFGITFVSDNKFSATSDCNNISGNYAATKNTIAFSKIVMTKMFCERSQENDFLTILENASNYHFTSRGELIIGLKFDSGTASFR